MAGRYNVCVMTLRDRFIRVAVLVLLVVLVSAPPSARGQASSPAKPEDPATAGIRSELERMREEIAAMRTELRSLRELLQRLATPPPHAGGPMGAPGFAPGNPPPHRAGAPGTAAVCRAVSC